MGAAPDYEGEARGDTSWDKPPEDIANEGCPGSWYRTAFVRSLARYRRAMDAQGNRIDNKFYEHCDDPFVWECLDRWEAEEMAAENYRLTVIQGA